MKISAATVANSFLPKMSLSFAQMIKKPYIMISCTSDRSVRCYLTNICEKIGRYKPTALIEALQVIGDSHQRSRNN